VQAATGSPFDEQVRERVLVPLRLTRSEPAAATGVPARLIHGYSPTRPRIDLTLPYAGTAAGLVSTAADLVRFERALFRGQVIPGQLVAAMRTPGSVGAMDTAGYDAYGLGLMRFPSKCGPASGHRGRIPGFTSWLLSTADGKRSVAALVTSGMSARASRASYAASGGSFTTALCT
jgi:D-alanyl-D-alanine carboxypeptidase